MVNPIITCPGDVTVNAATGLCNATVTYSAALAFDNCSATVTYSHASGSTFPVGVTTVTATATDPSGNTATCEFTVTVVDHIAPSITCPGNISEAVDAGACNAVVTFAAATASDNCSATVTYSHESGDTFPLGATTVTATATDGEGNTATCSFTVTVTDNEAPQITCPSDVTVSAANGSCSAIATYAVATATDNCSATITYSKASNTSFNVGETIVTATATDAAGNTATCSFTVTVEDNQDPTVSCPGNVTVNAAIGSCSVVVTYAAATASDNCSATVTYSQASNTSFSVGEHTVTVTATDPAGNTATCEFTITVNDTQNPVFSSCPSNVTVNADLDDCAAIVTFAAATATDNCSATITYSQESNTSFAVGVHTVTATATDPAGNTATCSFSVTVNDNQAPVLADCPTNITLTADAGECTTVVTYDPASVTDNCSATISYSTASGATMSVGVHTITVTATDPTGNSSTCTFSVTIEDTELPVITCPSDVTISTANNSCQATVTYAAATVTDNCSATLSYSHPSGSTFSIGATTVTVTATDASNNTVTCTFEVLVEDNQAPSVTCPGNRVVNVDAGECTAVVTFAAATASDNCSATVTYSQESNTAFSLGVNTVTATATDAEGNTATCTFTITVNDNEAPTLTCPGTVTATVDAGECGAVVTYDPVTPNDNCSASVLYSDESNTFFAVGNTTVTVTATDGDGNSATCTFVVTVVDNEVPEITAANDTTVSAAAGQCTAAGVTLNPPTVTDNCSALAATNNAPGVFPIGATTVTWTVFDVNGNSSTATQLVTVVDAEAPSIVCPGDTAVTLYGSDYTFPDLTSLAIVSDNCSGSVDITQAPADGTVFSASELITVTFTATDAAGNSSTCSFNFDLTLRSCGILYVDSSATGANTGFSWEDAFTELSSALAVASGDCDTIFVAKGKYLPTNDGERDSTFRLVSHAPLYGGFPSGGSSFAQRNPAVHRTVLSGNIGDPNDATDNSYRVVTAKNLDTLNTNLSIFDGFVVVGGNSFGLGGGLYIAADSFRTCGLLVRNCIFENNEATVNGAGSGIVATAGGICDVVFEDCTFRNNASKYQGGGMQVTSQKGGQVEVAITDCSFTGNTAIHPTITGRGGGAFLDGQLFQYHQRHDHGIQFHQQHHQRQRRRYLCEHHHRCHDQLPGHELYHHRQYRSTRRWHGQPSPKRRYHRYDHRLYIDQQFGQWRCRRRRVQLLGNQQRHGARFDLQRLRIYRKHRFDFWRCCQHSCVEGWRSGCTVHCL